MESHGTATEHSELRLNDSPSTTTTAATPSLTLPTRHKHSVAELCDPSTEALVAEVSSISSPSHWQSQVRNHR